MTSTRRDFLAFLGRSALGLEATLRMLGNSAFAEAVRLPFTPLAPSDRDDLLVAEGFTYDVLLKWGDPLNDRGDRFGSNCDYIAFFPRNEAKTDGILWVNHESPDPLFLVSGHETGKPRTESQVLAEQQAVGGSLVRVKRDASGRWRPVIGDGLNRRLTASDVIPFAWEEPIAGARRAVGTLANCAGGVTPWNTVLSAEENYQDYYGEVDRSGKLDESVSRYGWQRFHRRSPLHYGWIVEVNPVTGEAKKLVALGRFCHEGATVVRAKDGRPVVYMGDDAEDRCLYKFVADRKDSLERGTLFVADTKAGRWIPLDRSRNERLKREFKTQTEVLLHTREAAAVAGGTPLNRPEDIAVDPVTGNLILALTNSAKRGDPHGSLMKIAEKGADPLATELEATTFLAGGPETGFASPDNLEFDRKGDLWMTTDISGRSLNRTPYTPFKNNGLFVIPTSGPWSGRALQVASAPRDAEFTGPHFTPDGKQLFLCVQHPGETSASPEALTSHWPEGGKALPRSAVVVLSGRGFGRLI